MRKRRVAAGCDLRTSRSTTAKYVRRPTSVAAGSGRAVAGNGLRTGLSTGLSTTIKYVRRAASGAAGSGLGTTANYLYEQEKSPRARPTNHGQVLVTNNCGLICRVFFSCCDIGLDTGLGTTITYERPKLRPATQPRRRYTAARAT